VYEHWHDTNIYLLLQSKDIGFKTRTQTDTNWSEFSSSRIQRDLCRIPGPHMHTYMTGLDVSLFFLISTGLSPGQHAKTSYDCSADNFILFTAIHTPVHKS